MSIEKIINMVFQRTGIDINSIGESAFNCAIRIRSEKTNCSDIDQYHALLLRNAKEFNFLIEEIIVPETWFFRDPFAFKALITHIKSLPHTNSPFKILCMPSSSGEEAYTVAISLLENNISPNDFIIDAIDISQKNINTALIGEYRKNSFRSEISESVLSKYFTRTDSVFKISKDVKNSINFIQGNIFDPDTLNKPQEYDVVFCRNMLIYFNKERKDQAVQIVGDTLKYNGLLLIGHSETALLPPEKFTPSTIKKSFAFIKHNNKPVPPEKISSIKKHPSTATKKKIVQSKPESAYSKNINSESHERTLTTASLDDAQKAADNGQLEAAYKICIEIEKREASQHCFALAGSILTAMGNLQEAEKKFRKAIFLDPHHHDSLLQLAFLMEKKGDFRSAALLKKRAQKHQTEKQC